MRARPTGDGPHSSAAASAALVAFLLLAAGLGACGGSTASSSSATAVVLKPHRPSAKTTRTVVRRAAPARHHSYRRAAGFRRPGDDESIQEYGSEAPVAQREAAGAVLVAYLHARAGRSWKAACGQLAKGMTASLEALTGGKAPRGCAAALAALSGGPPAAALADPAPAGMAGIGALRVGGGRNFALFHGRRGLDYFLPMAEEGGAWKVAAVAPSELP